MVDRDDTDPPTVTGPHPDDPTVERVRDAGSRLAEVGRARPDDAGAGEGGPESPGRGSSGPGSAGSADRGSHQSEMPRVRVTRARLFASIVFVVSVVAFLYFVLPKLVGLKESWERLQQGDVWWLAVALVLEALSFLSYILLFRAVFVDASSRIGWRVSYQITMAGLAATRLFAAAGAGGIALTAWALARSGMDARTLASRMIAFMSLLYGVYMSTLVIDGLGLYFGVFEGPAPFAITVIPAIFGASVIILFAAVAALPANFDRLVERWIGGTGLIGSIARRLATVPTAASRGIRTAIGLLRTRNPALLGAIGWWGFDIATLWACFHAFGASPHKAVIVMAYFVGWIANTLPLPGGIGGVEGGMIGAFTAFGVDVQTAVVAVLAYRAISFWLPTIPGVAAYLQLRRTVARWRTS
ncbi:MAG: lysylphosphatidylglycerol synthase transmembrane domain-containing protein [Solirubrobacteraceae bacterium]